QLDPFHRNKAVREKIHAPKAVHDIMELLEEEKVDELFEYLEVYKNSLGEDSEIKDAEDLIRYYKNNREGFIPYQSQGLELPEHPQGLEYRNMGTMENHVWSVIARRMNYNHTSWSRRGGNYLAKILAKKCSGKLYEVTEKVKRPVFEEEKVEELYGEILMAAKAPKRDGKGYEYPIIGHVVGLDGKIQGERRKLLCMVGF
ncbi:MAG: UPF0236 family transposase-like protein, partial [Candidatus Fimimorpha sp.]